MLVVTGRGAPAEEEDDAEESEEKRYAEAKSES